MEIYKIKILHVTDRFLNAVLGRQSPALQTLAEAKKAQFSNVATGKMHQLDRKIMREEVQ